MAPLLAEYVYVDGREERAGWPEWLGKFEQHVERWLSSGSRFGGLTALSRVTARLDRIAGGMPQWDRHTARARRWRISWR